MKKLSVSLVFLALLFAGCSSPAAGPSDEEIANFQTASSIVSTAVFQSTSGASGSILKSINTEDFAPSASFTNPVSVTNVGIEGSAVISGTYILNYGTSTTFTVAASITFNNFKSSSTNEVMNGSVTVSETGTMTGTSYDITASEKADLTYGGEALDWDMAISMKMSGTSVQYTYNGTINGQSYTGTASGAMGSL